MAGVWAVISVLGLTSQASAAASKEYEVKAAFLVKLAKLVEWPAAAFAKADDPFTIGVLGNDPFGAALDDAVSGVTIHGRKVAVLRSKEVQDLKACHVLFVSQSEKANLAQVLAALGEASILTMGDTDGFAQRGGVINLYIEEGRVRFEINPNAARRKALDIPAQLLKLGKVVG